MEQQKRPYGGMPAPYEGGPLHNPGPARNPTWETIKRDMKAEVDSAYCERNQVVAAFASLAASIGWEVYWSLHPVEDASWERDWRHILFIETPFGQLSWHFHDSEFHLIEKFGFRTNKWDGHSTDLKYRRLESLISGNATKRESVGESGGAECDCGSGWRCEIHPEVKPFTVTPSEMRALKQSGDWEKILKGQEAP